MKRVFIVAAALLVGCDTGDTTAAGDDNETDAFGDVMPDDLPAGNCGVESSDEDCETDGSSTGLGDSTTGGPEGDCLVNGCTGQGVCAAEWNAETEERGPFECRFSCIPLVDDTSWCSNAASCCDSEAVCTERGYCVLGEGADGSSGSGDGSSGGDESGTDGTGTGGSGSTGTGGMR